mmetsp:Transcript_45543/g.144909  ORF Transcript_45543/g.144909 Transcript_45543/m.144909 type:complete len:150 (+) Transcript_45543:598-1047(+)
MPVNAAEPLIVDMSEDRYRPGLKLNEHAGKHKTFSSPMPMYSWNNVNFLARYVFVRAPGPSRWLAVTEIKVFARASETFIGQGPSERLIFNARKGVVGAATGDSVNNRPNSLCDLKCGSGKCECLDEACKSKWCRWGPGDGSWGQWSTV